MNGTFLLKCLAAFCMLGNVTASPTPTCGCSEAISALRVEFQAKYVEFQAKYDAQQALIDYVANEVQDVRECSACVSPSPPPPSPSPPPSPPPPQYFLADGGKSCSQACADMSNNACNLGAITSAASSVARCSDVVRSLNMSFTQSGMYRNDDDNRASGCTFRPNQAGNWAQVGNSTRDGAAPAPTCDEVNADSSRRRVCACG